MKTLKLALVFAAVIGGLLTSATADARWRHHHHHGARFGIFIGAPLVAYPYYAYPRYYPAPVVAPAPVYVEPAPQASSNYWYYCRESAAYYPYVQTCPSPWQPVVPNQ